MCDTWVSYQLFTIVFEQRRPGGGVLRFEGEMSPISSGLKLDTLLVLLSVEVLESLGDPAVLEEAHR